MDARNDPRGGGDSERRACDMRVGARMKRRTFTVVVIAMPGFEPKAGETDEQTARRLRKYNDAIRAVRRWKRAA